jgi:sulfur-carrier protein adenylyltransferase/sulfurtransferase
MSIPEVTVQQLKALLDAKADIMILDVRNPDEYAICNLGGHLIPFKELATRLHELNPSQQIIIHCHGGGRSSRATDFLMQQGFKHVYNLRGGITAWANEIDQKMAKY